MKKTVICLGLSAILAGSLFGLDINPSGAKATVTAYKTAKKLAVPFIFKDTKFSFAKDSGSVADILKGTKATLTLSTIDTGKNTIRDNNIKNKLFSHLASQIASGEVLSVTGDDTSGNLKAKIELNGVSQEIDMKYEVKDNAIDVSGDIDMEKEFDMKNAFETFASDKVIQGLHAKKTWPTVTISFKVPLK